MNRLYRKLKSPTVRVIKKGLSSFEKQMIINLIMMENFYDKQKKYNEFARYLKRAYKSNIEKYKVLKDFYQNLYNK